MHIQAVVTLVIKGLLLLTPWNTGDSSNRDFMVYKMASVKASKSICFGNGVFKI